VVNTLWWDLGRDSRLFLRVRGYSQIFQANLMPYHQIGHDCLLSNPHLFTIHSHLLDSFNVIPLKLRRLRWIISKAFRLRKTTRKHIKIFRSWYRSKSLLKEKRAFKLTVPVSMCNIFNNFKIPMPQGNSVIVFKISTEKLIVYAWDRILK
jgi:hypothetical protein